MNHHFPGFPDIKKWSGLIGLPLLFFLLSCGEQSTSLTEKKDYAHLGDSLINLTFDTLRNALTSALREKGAAGAVSYCNENAYPITGIHASANISIKRVAERYRNPKNAPDSLDALQWNKFVEAKAKGEPLKPILASENNTTFYYKPMLLQPMCTACHGKSGTDILPAVVTVIDSLYPGDKAKGFAPGELRGMWKLSFVQE